MSEMRGITSFDNPHSVQQMKEWLSYHGGEMESLSKKEFSQFVKNPDGNANDNITDALKLAKSSV